MERPDFMHLPREKVGLAVATSLVRTCKFWHAGELLEYGHTD